jgi:hypothetical protein
MFASSVAVIAMLGSRNATDGLNKNLENHSNNG